MMRKTTQRKQSLRKGFSTGTAATAAARAALRHYLTGKAPQIVAVRLPVGYFLPVRVQESHQEENGAWASVIKNAGDDPDITHRAELRARVCLFFGDNRVNEGINSKINSSAPQESKFPSGICLVGGKGVGQATKPGLPIEIGEPAINPVPRSMLSENLTEELMLQKVCRNSMLPRHKNLLKRGMIWSRPVQPHVFLPFTQVLKHRSQGDCLEEILLEVEIQVPKGPELARHTLNPRLGIQGGISILGTTGIVKPFSHEAYEETIESALSVATSNSCEKVVLSTGGKSERLAQAMLPDWPEEAFVQVADFFAFAVQKACEMGFKAIVHSVFFGKVVKMAQGHAYTHAHTVPLDLNPLAQLARDKGYDETFCRQLASANTARHALELLLARQDKDVIHSMATQALKQSTHLTENQLTVRLLLFHYDETLLADVKSLE
jgi:cobalt-precorrin-5B (C1)-methyltransferase